MKSLKLLIAGSIAFVLSSAASAVPITVNFDSIPTGTPFVAPVIENGMLLTPTATGGNPTFTDPFFPIGPPVSAPNYLTHTNPGAFSFDVQGSGGELFQLVSFLLGTSFGGGGPITVEGWLGGSSVGSEVFNPVLDTWVLNSPTGPLLGTLVDTLSFDMGPAIGGPNMVDDMVFDVVPEPSTFALMALGMLGLVAAGRGKAS